MAEPQFDPAQPFTVAAPPAASMHAPRPNDPVTVGDLIDDPQAAIVRIGQSLKRDLSDPNLWLQAAAMYFGPKALEVALPIVGRAAVGAMKATARGAVNGTAAAGDLVSPDLIGIASPRVGKVVEAAQRMRAAMGQPQPPTRAVGFAGAAAPTPTPRTVAPVTAAAPPPVEPPAPVPVAAAPEPAPTAQPTPRALNEARLAELRAKYQAAQAAKPMAIVREVQTVAAAEKVKLTGAEMRAAMDLRKSGLTAEQALQSIVDQRALLARFGGLPTALETKAAIAAKQYKQ